MRNLIPFMTRIPIHGDFEKARQEIWAFPMLAVITSALSTVVLYFNVPLKNILAVLFLYFTIGLLHLDGLADFADGIMTKGDRERKIKAMKDLNTGIAGIFAVVMVLLIQVYSLSYAPFYALFLAELNSKYAMVLALSTKKPLGQGLGAYFMEAMNRKQLLLATIIYTLLLMPFFLYEWRAVISVLGFLIGAYIIKLSLDNFDGLNGDCIGAVAEITRAGTLLILAFIWWYL
ncbi:adenosylcobinamide-GDP ribazoletransferase [Thermococcus sp. M39]|uniref:adenosylcobinamide-GDP ribazoletransferase n=1 Tax=unclassified Thermococcus TaxID=2627626 RepID=UPI001439A749|nr:MULTISPECIES: adenosylcobinamide-GDP ribazoletransferase [unclassified Thermococcus]NJE09115.1 adenosylcobinamide-GDP ribazoletransferase [Thermococcus sp. M39]NJE12064.1 adenosylcobinamide-GDP ribazoletransferase [Thermococcus sp. LS2]